jgi:hypothetical protein
MKQLKTKFKLKKYGVEYTPFLSLVSMVSRRATGWTAGVGFPAGARCFPSPQCPDRFWGPPSLLSNEYRGSFYGVRQLGREAEIQLS